MKSNLLNKFCLVFFFQFFSFSQVDVTRSNAQSLLATASLLQMLPVQRACAKFMEMQLDINNCIGIHAFAHAHSCPELSIKAREFIEKNFTQVSHTDEFLELSATQILDLLASDELNVEKEEVSENTSIVAKCFTFFCFLVAVLFCDEKAQKMFVLNGCCKIHVSSNL